MATQLKHPIGTVIKAGETERITLAGSRRRRAPWRQRLIEAERGMAQGLRGDSTIFGHFFAATIVTVTGLVLGINLLQWTVLVLALGVVLTAALFEQSLRALLRQPGSELSEPARRSLRIAAAGVFAAIATAVIIVAMIFGSQLWEIFTS